MTKLARSRVESAFVQERARHLYELFDGLALEDPVLVLLVDRCQRSDLRLRLVLGDGHVTRAVCELLDLARMPAGTRECGQRLVEAVCLRSGRLRRRGAAPGKRERGRQNDQPPTAHSTATPSTAIPNV